MIGSRFFLVAGLIAATSLVAGCGKQLASKPLDRTIVIDGKDDEWSDARFHLDTINGSLGVFNDQDFLYLSLSMRDPYLQWQVIGRGFTLWLDAKGKRNTSFGVRFPLGMPEKMMGGMRYGPGGMPGGHGPMGGGRRGRRNYINPRQVQVLFDEMMERAELEIIGPNPKQIRRLELGGRGSVQLGVSYNAGRLVYEAKIPFLEIYARAGAKPNFEKGLSLGLETPEFDGAAMGGRRGGMGGMDGGGMGGMGGMGGGVGGGMGGSRPTALELWTKIQLAEF